MFGKNEQKEEKMNQLERDKQKDKQILKMMMIGSGSSGKSTIFKQVQTLYGKQLKSADRKVFVEHIHEQCIVQMKIVLDVIDEYIDATNDDDDKEDDNDVQPGLHEFFGKNKQILKLSEPALQAKEIVECLHYTSHKLNDEIVSALKLLWQEPVVQKIYELRHITKVVHSSAFFWNKLDTINSDDYEPDDRDILSVRYRTTGTKESKYDLKNQKKEFSIIDVGGAKSERKKWIKCFNGLSAIIFVAGLSCYDEIMWEDWSTNMMTDQLKLFDDICSNELLQEIPIFLFLTHKDLFEIKIQTVPLQKCSSFADYSGNSNSSEETTNYVKAKFESLHKRGNGNLFVYVMCGHNKNEVTKAFNDTLNILQKVKL
eukprot:176029_1